MKLSVVHLFVSLVSAVPSFSIPFLEWFTTTPSVKPNLRGTDGSIVGVLAVYNFADVPSLVYLDSNGPAKQEGISDVAPTFMNDDDDDGNELIVLGDLFYDDFYSLDTVHEQQAGDTSAVEQDPLVTTVTKHDEPPPEMVPIRDYFYYNSPYYLYDDDYSVTWKSQQAHHDESGGHYVEESQQGEVGEEDQTDRVGYGGVDDDWYWLDDDWWQIKKFYAWA